MFAKIKEPLTKALAELARVAVLAAIPVLIVSFENGLVDWQLVAVTASVAVLRALDKMLHKLGEQENNERLAKGLTRF